MMINIIEYCNYLLEHGLVVVYGKAELVSTAIKLSYHRLRLLQSWR